jgi:spermidine/putrescine transport system permease protein
MIRSLPSSGLYRWSFRGYVGLYFLFLFAPLLVTCILAFNDSMFPSLPWKGFTFDWFFSDGPQKIGFFHDQKNLRSLYVSIKVAFSVTIISTLLGTCAAFLFEQEEFRFKNALYFLMLAPMVIPGVILGISILMFTNTLGLFFENVFGWDLELLRPGYWLVVLGQVSFISTFVALVVIARLRKFDRTLEEAAMNLGASRLQAIWLVTLRYLKPALVGSAAVAFLMSFENFNTTLFLVGSESTIPITLYLQVRDGSTPVINAISFILILTSSIIALVNVLIAKRES